MAAVFEEVQFGWGAMAAQGLGEEETVFPGDGAVVEAVDEQGVTQKYEVYFTTSRSTQRGILNLYVQSAYVRDRAHKNNQPRKKAIRLHAILHNTLTNKPIKAPPR